MRNVVNAAGLIAASAAQLGLADEIISQIFKGIPVDFRVIITSKLPFYVHRFGISGITIFGAVYLHNHTLDYSPESFFLLLRHEAEHVRQQRCSPVMFYPRYLLGWLGHFVAILATGNAARGAWHRAYLLIAAEREAYGAERSARALLRTAGDAP